MATSDTGFKSLQVTLLGDDNRTHQGLLLLYNWTLIETGPVINAGGGGGGGGGMVDGKGNTNPAANPVGAAYYVVAVILIYALSIVMLIASRVRRKHAKILEDRQIHKYLQEFQTVREKSHRDTYRNLKRMVIARLGPSRVPKTAYCNLSQAIMPAMAFAMPSSTEVQRMAVSSVDGGSQRSSLALDDSTFRHQYMTRSMTHTPTIPEVDYQDDCTDNDISDDDAFASSDEENRTAAAGHIKFAADDIEQQQGGGGRSRHATVGLSKQLPSVHKSHDRGNKRSVTEVVVHRDLAGSQHATCRGSKESKAASASRSRNGSTHSYNKSITSQQHADVSDLHQNASHATTLRSGSGFPVNGRVAPLALEVETNVARSESPSRYHVSQKSSASSRRHTVAPSNSHHKMSSTRRQNNDFNDDIDYVDETSRSEATQSLSQTGNVRSGQVAVISDNNSYRYAAQSRGSTFVLKELSADGNRTFYGTGRSGGKSPLQTVYPSPTKGRGHKMEHQQQQQQHQQQHQQQQPLNSRSGKQNQPANALPSILLQVPDLRDHGSNNNVKRTAALVMPSPRRPAFLNVGSMYVGESSSTNDLNKETGWQGSSSSLATDGQSHSSPLNSYAIGSPEFGIRGSNLDGSRSLLLAPSPYERSNSQSPKWPHSSSPQPPSVGWRQSPSPVLGLRAGVGGMSSSPGAVRKETMTLDSGPGRPPRSSDQQELLDSFVSSV